ncbi:MAG: F-box protein [Legionella sp.]|jgi:hypothetical protein
MESDVVHFIKLPTEIKIEIAQNLSSHDLATLSTTSKVHLALFKPMIDVRKFLYYVTHGEHDAVKAMLKKDVSLIFRRGRVTDCSGREFGNVSGFEYTLWSLDKYMWVAMIACIPSSKKGKKVFTQLIAQYNKVNTEGVSYRLKGKTITEQHFDFKNTIIKELQTQVDSLSNRGDKTPNEFEKQWREGVGGAQYLLPIPVVDEYCSDESFFPVPKFNTQPKSSRQFYNWITQKNENWISQSSKLSVDFAIYKGGGGWAGDGCVELRTSAVECGALRPSERDLNAMTALCEVRTNDFIILKSQLEKQAGLDNHQVVRHYPK